MLKYLVALVVVLGLAFVVARQDQHAADQAAQKAADLHKAAVPAEPDEQHSQENVENPAGDSPRWYILCLYGLFRWPNGTETWAIILTLMAIAEQTKHTAKAAEAGRMAAKTALANTQAIVNSERAWIVISVESPAPNTYIFKATNVGRTPAKIISIHPNVTRTRRPDPLPMPLVYREDDDPLISLPPHFLPPTASSTVFHISIATLRGNASEEEWMQHLRMGFSELFFYGRVRYYDTLETDPKAPHETTWLYWLLPIQDALPIPDPHHPECNNHT